MGNRSMFVGMDVHKETIDISVAEGGRQGEVRHYGSLLNGRSTGRNSAVVAGRATVPLCRT